MLRVLDEDPDLGRFLSPAARAPAASAALAPLMTLDRGTASFLIDEADTHGHFGLLMLSGVLVRHVTFGSIGSNDFLGPGDLVPPWTGSARGPREAARVRWEALAPIRLAVLDREFASRIRAWPEIASALLGRAAQRSDSQALQAALQQAKRVEDRVLLALWHFAGRWGEIEPEGRVLSMPELTGEVLARFIGARRQSVSTALGKLIDIGAMQRLADHSILIPDQPPQLSALQPGRRATDRMPRLKATS